mgnify:CR=1 FL=1
MTQPSIQAGFTQVGDSLVRELGKYLTDPSMISLAGGYPGSDLFDVPGLSASMDKALSQHSIASLAANVQAFVFGLIKTRNQVTARRPLETDGILCRRRCSRRDRRCWG